MLHGLLYESQSRVARLNQQLGVAKAWCWALRSTVADLRVSAHGCAITTCQSFT